MRTHACVWSQPAYSYFTSPNFAFFSSRPSIILDSELSFVQHASKLTQTCFFHWRRLRVIRRSLTNAALLTRVHAFIATRFDYCNSALFGSKTSVTRRLQSIQNSSARLILNILKLSESLQSCVIRYTGYLCTSASRSRSVRSSDKPEQFARALKTFFISKQHWQALLRNTSPISLRNNISEIGIPDGAASQHVTIRQPRHLTMAPINRYVNDTVITVTKRAIRTHEIWSQSCPCKQTLSYDYYYVIDLWFSLRT